ncbi:MAG: hypothetical protein HFE94_06455 [Acutalibacter sp.]|nr:hypothetical protein [Acutalibacter sp.]
MEKTRTYRSFPSEHGSCARTSKVMEQLNRETHRRTRGVGVFSKGRPPKSRHKICGGLEL